MIYFSDLDRTLIYSDKFLEDKSRYICIESLNNKGISYTSEKAITLLSKILDKKTFIPVTTRSIEQYKRIMFKENNINFKWSIVSNGGNILYEGEVVEEWTKLLNENIKQCESLKNVMKYFYNNYKNAQGILKIRDVDNIFFYIVVDTEIYNLNFNKDLRRYLLNVNWNLYSTGRKIYFIPKVVTKESAIEFLMKYFKKQNFIALGDSILDLNMLKKAKKGYTPNNSYLHSNALVSNIIVSKEEGVKAAEEILEDILKENIM